MTGLNDLLPVFNFLLWQGFVVFVRVSAIVALMPAFGEQSIPARIKLIIALAFTAIVAPAVPMALPPPETGFVTLIILTEVVSGVIIGIGLRLFILALQTAGSIAAQSTSLSQVLGGAAVDPLPAMGYILIVAGLALATMAGLHVKASMLIIYSYQFLPVGQFTGTATVTEWGIRQVAEAFALAFTLAAPFVILSVLYNLALGAINRAMPQLMVAFVGAPVITLGGLLLLFAAAPFMLQVWVDAMDGYMANPFEVRR